MATTLQFRRGNSAAAAAVTGANGEIYINTQTKQLIIHDGATAGGFALANASSVAAKANAFVNVIENGSNVAIGNTVTGCSYVTVSGTSLVVNVAQQTTFTHAVYVGGDVTVDGDMVPTIDGVYDIGTDLARWDDVFVSGTVDINGSTLVGTTSGSDNVLTTQADFVANTLTATSALIGDVSVVGSTISALDSYGAPQLLTVDGDLNVNGAFTVGGVAVGGSYTLPTANTTTLGGVKVDGTTITINSGVISAAGSYTLPTANTSALGGVKIDGTSIISNNGIISVGGIENVTSITVQSGDVFINTVSSSVFYIQNPPYNFQATFGVPNELYTNGRAATYVLVIDQGSTPHIANTLAIGYSNPSISWQGGTTPTGNANKRDVISFTLMRQSDSWIVLGSLNTYG